MGMGKSSEIDLEVGRALRRLRQERAMTTADLAERADISAAMVSRIENGNVSPSLATLQAISDAMSISIMALFSNSGTSADVHHVRGGSGLPARRLTPGHAHDYMLLGKHVGTGGRFESARVKICRSETGILPTYQHEGHTFIYVISGEAIYSCGNQDFSMQAGDTLSFDAKLRHGFCEIVSEDIDFITVSAKPG